jgi:hypothetical protein
LDLLFELQPDLGSYNNVYICAYDVITTGIYPFQKFLLINNIIDNTLRFPQLKLIKGFSSLGIMNYTEVFLFSILGLDDFEILKKNIVFDGYFNENNDLYLFFDLTNCKLEINDISKNNNIWFTLIDEILNQKHLCNFKIDENVTSFFNSHNDFCFMLDEHNEIYEIPIVSYVGKQENKLNFTYIFGEIKSNKDSILGPFYYFTDYYNAFKDATEIAEKNQHSKKVGVVRFAIFLGVTKYIENFQNDKIDDSEIKACRLEDETLDKNMESLTMRISDHDGMWSNYYDSAHIGYIELDNGKFLEKPTIVLKEFERQIPLSYHYVDTKTYKNNYSIY